MQNAHGEPWGGVSRCLAVLLKASLANSHFHLLLSERGRERENRGEQEKGGEKGE